MSPGPHRCDPAELCVCDFPPSRLVAPMHWRPDVAPAAPWPWLDSRTRPDEGTTRDAPRVHARPQR